MPLSSRLPPFAQPLSWLDVTDPMTIGAHGFARAIGRVYPESGPLRALTEIQGRRIHARAFVGSIRAREGATAPFYEPWRLPSGSIRYHRVRVSDFDFSTAPVYLRRSIRKENVEFATVEQVVRTIIGGVEETSKVAKKGDAIVTGVLGERYVPQNFWGIYEDDPDDPWQYRPKPGVSIRAIELSAPAKFAPPWGGWQYCEVGFIVQATHDPRDARLIAKKAFDLTWYREPQD